VLNYLNTTPSRYVGENRYSSAILDLGNRWRWVVSFTHRPLCFSERARDMHLEMRMGEPHSRSWPLMENRKISCPCRKTNPGCSARSPLPVAALTETAHKYSSLREASLVSPWNYFLDRYCSGLTLRDANDRFMPSSYCIVWFHPSPVYDDCWSREYGESW
jgi:hypothetical protein